MCVFIIFFPSRSFNISDFLHFSLIIFANIHFSNFDTFKKSSSLSLEHTNAIVQNQSLLIRIRDHHLLYVFLIWHLRQIRGFNQRRALINHYYYFSVVLSDQLSESFDFCLCCRSIHGNHLILNHRPVYIASMHKKFLKFFVFNF